MKDMKDSEVREYDGKWYRCEKEGDDANGCEDCAVPYNHKDWKGKSCPCSVANEKLGECFRADGDYYFVEVPEIPTAPIDNRGD